MFDELLGQLMAIVSEDLLNMLVGLAILIVGWIVARIIKAVVYRLMKRMKLDNRLASTVAEGEEPSKLNIEKWVSTGAFYLVMLFVLVAFFQTIQLPGVAAPLTAMLEQIALAAPQLLGAVLILFAAWLFATIVKFIIRRINGITTRAPRSHSVGWGEAARLVRSMRTKGVDPEPEHFLYNEYYPHPPVRNAIGFADILMPQQF